VDTPRPVRGNGPGPDEPEAALAKLAERIAAGTGPKGQDKIARAVGRIENRYMLAKLFDIAIAAEGFTFARNPQHIASETRLDGFYVIRTSVETNAFASGCGSGSGKASMANHS
jgi:hypothetical protein